MTFNMIRCICSGPNADESLHFHELVHVIQVGGFSARRIFCCCTPLGWLNMDTVIVRSKRWPSIISEDSTPVSHRTLWRRQCGGRRWF
jgi:hypothetical protein